MERLLYLIAASLTYLSKQTLYQISLIIGVNLMERRGIMELLNPCSGWLKPDKTSVEHRQYNLLNA
jgi:hypothetical protein